ncbi:MAG: DUF86 domain-containing protein [Promethearchaeota archaeon]|nr:MAG: DUF86 domain-containing protein [Candidatus Lokiarchaeota archaeon]
MDKIHHIHDEIEYLSINSKGLTFEKFIQDETLKRAFVRSLEIIGEAVKLIPNQVLERYNQIEWKKIAGMRDKLIHRYFGIDYELVWDVIENHIPKLKEVMDIIVNGP